MMPPAGSPRQFACLRSTSPERAWGFSLMEVMVSLVILSVGLLGIAAQSISVIRANSLSDQITRATVLAKDKMEELKRLGYTHTQLKDTDNSIADVSADVTTYPSLFTNPDHSDTNPNSETGTVTLTSTPTRVWNVADNTPATGMKTITIIVGWKTKTSGTSTKSHYVALTTIMHEYM